MSLPNICKQSSPDNNKAAAYVFPTIEAEEVPNEGIKLPFLVDFTAEFEEKELSADPEETAEDFETDSEAGEEPEAEPESEPEKDPTPVDLAQLQAEVILAEARAEAERILAETRERAKEEAELIRRTAEEEGRADGYEEGIAQALEEGKLRQEEQAALMADEVDRFLEQAGAALDRQLDENVNELRDLAIAIAEKVVSISLRSSTEIIGRMVQAALDKRKHREWIHIYISESDAKRMSQVPAALTNAVAGLSDRVRIIPMADDDSGTLVIEMPDEIIDASASTQLGNIRSMLMNGRAAETEISTFGNFGF